jgi:hypothetical protein
LRKAYKINIRYKFSFQKNEKKKYGNLYFKKKENLLFILLISSFIFRTAAVAGGSEYQEVKYFCFLKKTLKD